jgi:hypothetical protein
LFRHTRLEARWGVFSQGFGAHFFLLAMRIRRSNDNEGEPPAGESSSLTVITEHLPCRHHSNRNRKSNHPYLSLASESAVSMSSHSDEKKEVWRDDAPHQKLGRQFQAWGQQLGETIQTIMPADNKDKAQAVGDYGSIKVTPQTEATTQEVDLEAGSDNDNEHFLVTFQKHVATHSQRLQEETVKFHARKVAPLLSQAGDSLLKAKAHTLLKSKEAGDAMRQATEQTLAKSKEFGARTAQKSREMGSATLAKSQALGHATVVKSRELGLATVQGTRSMGMSTQMAAAATLAQTTHTMSQIGSDPVERDEDGKPMIKGEGNDFFVTHLHAYGVQAVAVVAGLAALVTMVLLEGHLIDWASLGTMLLAPLVFWQKMQLKALGGLRGQVNAMRKMVNTLTVEINGLTGANDALATQVDGYVCAGAKCAALTASSFFVSQIYLSHTHSSRSRSLGPLYVCTYPFTHSLQGVETKLEAVAAKSGAQVDRLVRVVHENGELQQQIKVLLEDEVVQNIMTAIIMTDRNGDFRLDRREVYELQVRLSSLPAIHFDKAQFENFLASDEGDLTLADLTNIIHNIKDESIPDQEKIFHFKPSEILEEKEDA